jgi:hypothetical protein
MPAPYYHGRAHLLLADTQHQANRPCHEPTWRSAGPDEVGVDVVVDAGAGDGEEGAHFWAIATATAAAAAQQQKAAQARDVSTIKIPVLRRPHRGWQDGNHHHCSSWHCDTHCCTARLPVTDHL